MKAVIQAGGKGTRLRPYTFVVPKPMMPIGEEPVIEVLLKWLRRWDIKETYITTGYLGHLIRALVGDGSQWDMDIRYSEEFEPLGTIGPLVNIKERLTETFLVLNGDLITDLDLCSFVEFHKQNGAQVTVACTDQAINIAFGVIDNQNGNGNGHNGNGHNGNGQNGNGRITGFREKPKMNFQVSMGIYCMEPSILKLIPHGVPFGFDNLMHTMLKHDLPVYIYKHDGIWLDIGQEKDFNDVQKNFVNEYKPLILGC